MLPKVVFDQRCIVFVLRNFDRFGSSATLEFTRCIHLKDCDYSTCFFVPGAQIDDAVPQRAGMKVSQPPGGKSSALW